jgi:6-phosphogluconolactonase (cycloisomerase 2 family)
LAFSRFFQIAKSRPTAAQGWFAQITPTQMEIMQRMSKRFAWLLGVLVLVAIGLLVACGTTYKASSDGLVLLGSQGSAVIETFSFGLNDGHISEISNPPATNGQPLSIVLDATGAYAYVASTVTCTNASLTGAVQAAITAYKVNSDGTLSAKGSAQYLQGNAAYPTGFPACGLDDSTNPNPGNAIAAISMDSSGKFLFVATLTGALTYNTSSATLPGAVLAFSIGSGTLTAVPGTFTMPATVQTPSFAAVAATPTSFPAPINEVQTAVCSSLVSSPPTSEYLYAADAANNVVWEFAVNPKTGALSNPPGTTQVASFPAGAVPSGVAVDACDRFVYVSNNQSNNISAYTICTAVSLPACPNADGSLHPVTRSPFSLSGGANGPGPLLVDPFGNYLYVLDTLSNQISIFKISPYLGSLTAGSPPVVQTGTEPTSMAIRSDDNWLFVANFQSGSLSQFSITPATGVLNPLPVTTTDNYPWGVAVK